MAAAIPSNAAKTPLWFHTQIRGAPVVPEVSCMAAISVDAGSSGANGSFLSSKSSKSGGNKNLVAGKPLSIRMRSG